MIGFWAFLKIFWTHLPAFISLAETIARWIQAGLNEIEIKKRLAVFDRAMKKAQETHDTSDLEGLFTNPNPKP